MSGEVCEGVVRVIGANFAPDKYHPTQEDVQHLMASPMLQSADTTKATYVWLPIRFDGDRALIDWRESWTPEEG